ncbi:hypothetical protein J4Q44_G00072120 [Coregonus suidteri]|uniref:Uncharacterized protein n=1 Tax=Coregonus suidteri TaxID=861788 RepID=A0AAN8MER9_9TELE
MHVNFLPLPTWEGPEPRMSVSSGELSHEMTKESSQDSVSDARTVHWVASLPESSDGPHQVASSEAQSGASQGNSKIKLHTPTERLEHSCTGSTTVQHPWSSIGVLTIKRCIVI